MLNDGPKLFLMKGVFYGYDNLIFTENLFVFIKFYKSQNSVKRQKKIRIIGFII